MKSEAPAPSALETVAGMAGEHTGERTLTYDSPAIAKDVRGFIEADRQAKEWASRRDTHAAQIAAAAGPGRVDACRHAGRAAPSVVVNGKLTYTQKNQFAVVPQGALPRIRRAFKGETERYFQERISVELSPAAVNEETLRELLEKLGEERFRALFNVTSEVVVTDAFYDDWTLKPSVEEKARGLIDEGLIRPYKPTLRVA